MEKVEVDGEVAVLITNDYGVGWATEHSHLPNALVDVLLFHPRLVGMVMLGQRDEITYNLISELFDEELNETEREFHICTLGAKHLIIEWVPKGTLFYVDDYDGCETIVSYDRRNRIA